MDRQEPDKAKTTKSNGWNLVLGIKTDETSEFQPGYQWFLCFDELNMGKMMSQSEREECFPENAGAYFFTTRSKVRVHEDMTGREIMGTKDLDALKARFEEQASNMLDYSLPTLAERYKMAAKKIDEFLELFRVAELGEDDNEAWALIMYY